MQKTQIRGQIPESGRPPGEGNDNPLQYSCLENPMDRRVWRATVHGVTQSWTPLKHTWTSNKLVLLSCHSCVHWSSSLNDLHELYLCIHSLVGWLKTPGLQPTLIFNMPSSLNLITFSFWFKERDIRCSLSLKYLEALVGLLTGPISISCVLGNGEAWREGKGTIRTWIIYRLSLFIWAQSMVPHNIYNSNIKDHRSL